VIFILIIEGKTGSCSSLDSNIGLLSVTRLHHQIT